MGDPTSTPNPLVARVTPVPVPIVATHTESDIEAAHQEQRVAVLVQRAHELKLLLHWDEAEGSFRLRPIGARPEEDRILTRSSRS